MQKKYKHKITGIIGTTNKYDSFLHFERTCGESNKSEVVALESIHMSLVENSTDWEEIKEVKLEVPIGTKFKTKLSDTIYIIKESLNNTVDIYEYPDKSGEHGNWIISEVNENFRKHTWTIYKEKIALFLDELGNEVFEGDKVFGVLPKAQWDTNYYGGDGIPVEVLFRYKEGEILKTTSWKYFKNKVDAEKYITDNKPTFSRKQINNAIDVCDSYYTTHDDNYYVKVSHLKRLLRL